MSDKLAKVRSPGAKKILAEHLENTEKPGIRVLDVARAFATGKPPFADDPQPLDQIEYAGPGQDELVRKLENRRRSVAENELKKTREALK